MVLKNMVRLSWVLRPDDCFVFEVKDIFLLLYSSKGKPELPASTTKNLTDQITEMEDPNARIRDLVQRRLVEFNKQAISGSRTAPLQIPPGLTVCIAEEFDCDKEEGDKELYYILLLACRCAKKSWPKSPGDSSVSCPTTEPFLTSSTTKSFPTM